MYIAYKRFITHLKVKVSNLLTLDEFEMGFDTIFDACILKTISADERKGMVKRRVERHKEIARAETPGGGKSSAGKEASEMKWVSEEYLSLVQEAAKGGMFVDLQNVWSEGCYENGYCSTDASGCCLPGCAHSSPCRDLVSGRAGQCGKLPLFVLGPASTVMFCLRSCHGIDSLPEDDVC